MGLVSAWLAHEVHRAQPCDRGLPPAWRPCRSYASFPAGSRGANSRAQSDSQSGPSGQGLQHQHQPPPQQQQQQAYYQAYQQYGGYGSQPPVAGQQQQYAGYGALDSAHGAAQLKQQQQHGGYDSGAYAAGGYSGYGHSGKADYGASSKYGAGAQQAQQASAAAEPASATPSTSAPAAGAATQLQPPVHAQARLSGEAMKSAERGDVTPCPCVYMWAGDGGSARGNGEC
jgi:hypothetical protein